MTVSPVASAKRIAQDTVIDTDNFFGCKRSMTATAEFSMMNSYCVSGY